MAKSNAAVTKKYPDLSGLYEARKVSRIKRAKESPADKLRVLDELQELTKIFKSSKLVKKGGID